MSHKWHREIKAWADGAEIEEKYVGGMCIKDWTTQNSPAWHTEIGYEYRIKPQPKEPQYLYVYFNKDINQLALDNKLRDDLPNLLTYIGKIKLEVNDV